MSLHDAQKLGDHLRARPDHHLSLARLLGIVDTLQGIVENTGANHLDARFVIGEFEILRPLISKKIRNEVSAFVEKTIPKVSR